MKNIQINQSHLENLIRVFPHAADLFFEDRKKKVNREQRDMRISFTYKKKVSKILGEGCVASSKFINKDDCITQHPNLKDSIVCTELIEKNIALREQLEGVQ